jgi:AAA+ superfamily predicted ATPase
MVSTLEHETPAAVESLRPGTRPAGQLPDWYPAWAKSLGDLYFSGTTSVFVLHGNVNDLIHSPSGEKEGYCNLPEFLATQLFGRWDVVLSYDLSRGLRPLVGGDAERLRAMNQYLAGRFGGDLSQWPREPDKVLAALDEFLERMLVDPEESRKRVAVIFEHAEYLISEGGMDVLARGQAARLVRLLGWAQNPHIKRVNIAFCLVVEKLAEVNDRLVQSPYVATVEVPLPDRDQRLSFLNWSCRKADFSKLTDFTPEQLADMSSGLSLVSLNVLLSQGANSDRRVDDRRFKELKKTVIERQCQGLVEFVEPSHTLDLVVGQGEAKRRLQEDARLVCQGKLDVAPMGYLICGSVGTGKTFLAECYAGSIGIPCVMLKNFRSKYVGETEGNLQQVLTVLRSLGPVVVIIDEADAALGNRQAEGDSGTSARVFSMIAAQMGNTRYRGRIIWMLLTSRPDLLPIDLKRQGRAEVHIPLFHPSDEADIQAMFAVMAKKNRLKLSADAIPPVTAARRLTGADIESVMLDAKRHALADGREEVGRADLDWSLGEFIPSAQGLEKELQELAAVLECTQMSLLPPEWRQKVAEPGGRARLQERMAAVRPLIES